MMEVKQNTAVDLNDLLVSSKSNGSDEVDDAVMEDLTDRHPDLVHCDIMKPDDKTTNVVCMANGNIINDIEVDRDMNVPVNPELEDALLAGEDILPKLDSKQIEPISAAAEDDILADKVETSNSTTSSSNLRDPGDDLDTLLSKINDIVEDCIENEVDNNSILKSFWNLQIHP
ncbi:hypothetical protein DOY81_013407 [Sarcophaga bullata]|nr:hypothetical protein DOY81_013407 [Sarcophaga bullata]